jgi:hypothetical protein
VKAPHLRQSRRTRLLMTLIAVFALAISPQTPSAAGAVSSSVARITTSVDMSCGITSAGELYCWGNNRVGQVGDGTNIKRSVPTKVQVPGGGKWSGNVEGADGHTCAITTDGRLFCWGEGHQGRLGNGTEENRFVPTIVSAPDGSKWKQVDLSDASTCGLTVSGNMYCWGWLYGILNTGEYRGGEWFLTPQQVDLHGLRVDSFSYGNPNICALSSGRLYCWGGGLIPNATDADHITVPTLWGNPTQRWKVINSQGSWCGIDTADDLYCWGGSYSYYEIPCSVGDIEFSLETSGWEGCLHHEFVAATSPRKITVGSAKWRDVNARTNVCAITTADDLYCWGWNTAGELGIGTISFMENEPSLVGRPGGVGWAYAEVGDGVTCGVTLAGEFYCWGRDHDSAFDTWGCSPDPSENLNNVELHDAINAYYLEIQGRPFETYDGWYTDWPLCEWHPWGLLGNGAKATQSNIPVRADPPQSTVDSDALAPTAPGIAPLIAAMAQRQVAPTFGIAAARYRGVTYTVPATKFFAILKPTAPKYQWYRCPSGAAEASDNVDGLGCTLIARATQTKYKSTSADQGSYLRVRITSTNGRGAGAYTTTIFTPSTALVP